MKNMFRHSPVDPFNLENKRNISNTGKRTYNCAGYALETFSWYCPHNENNDFLFSGRSNYDFSTEAQAIRKTTLAVKKMQIDFGDKLRVIKNLTQLNIKTERVVAFRLSSDGDFHYIKKCANGQWYHKRGASCCIDRISENEVFHSVWCGRYDGPIVLLAIKK